METKKEVLIILVLVSFMFNLQSVYSSSIGITPGSVYFVYNPGQSYLINFHVVGADPLQNLSVYASGDLAQYVRFDKIYFNSSEVITAYIDLPEYIENPGGHTISIRVGEVIDKNAGIGTRLEIGSRVIIDVPYPGKYAEIGSFKIDNTNENDQLYMSLLVRNLGSEEIEPDAYIEVYSENKLLDRYNFDRQKISTFSGINYEKTLNNPYKVGTYKAFAHVTLNDDNKTVLTTNTTFSVGNIDNAVDILSSTNEVNKGKINSFNIQIKSKWNNDLSNVYATVNVTKDGNQSDFIQTPSVLLKKWEEAKLSGYMNAENLIEGDYNGEIIVNYFELKNVSKNVIIKVVIPETPKKSNLTLYIIIGVVAAILIISVIVFIIFKLKKVKPNAKKKNSRKN